MRMDRILVIKLRYHGDMLLTTPLISTLKSNYPSAKIDLLLYQDTAPILYNNPEINALYGIHRKSSGMFQQIKEFFQLFNTLKKNNYSLVLDLAEQWPIAFLVKLLDRPSIGFRVEGKNRWVKKIWNACFTYTTPAQGAHIIQQRLSILTPLKINRLIDKVSIYPTPQDWQKLTEQEPKLSKTNCYIVIQPTSRKSQKCWDNQKFAHVIDHLITKGLPVYITSGPSQSDLDMVDSIYQFCKQKPDIQFAGKTSMLELTALIKHARLFIGVDSVPMHIAAACNIPCVALFAARQYKIWRPWSSNSAVIWAGDYYTNNTQNKEDRNYYSLSHIPTSDVINAVDGLLNPRHATNLRH